jgi:demethylmenaquinone methyltransferase / 2-methoxy-6-polyprenyl-1,4-benzoquinol methylase
VTDLIELFAETARVLRPGGRVAFLETSEPDGRVLRAGHALYFRRIVPLIGGALSDRDAYRYLPRSTAYLPEPDRLLEMLGDAGFEQVERTPLGGGVAQMLVGTRR